MPLATDVAAAERRRGLSWVAAAYATAFLCAIAVAWELREADSLFVAAVADLVATLVVFAFSVSLDNSSIYDPYWSVAPIPLAVWWWWGAPAPSQPLAVRQAILIALVSVWGVRLTVNWVRRWRGLADEDFRYVEIRRRAGRGYWPASFVGIHLMPTAWVFLGLLPAYAAMTRPEQPLGALDLLGVAVVLAGLALEGTADGQLRAFRQDHRGGADVLDTGVWAWCRHPNYCGEVLFWWGIYLVGLSARPTWAWTIIGPLSITLLFTFVSVPWMDRHMASRHPGWNRQMERTHALVPWPRRP